MADVSITRVMDRVSVHFDCKDDLETQKVYHLLMSQFLDRYINIRIGDPPDVDSQEHSH